MTLQILPVFVSSTWIDLQPERAAVKDAVLRLRETQFVGMEHFGSRDETTRRASLDEVDRSSVYVGIIAARYGSGITEAEYRRARERGLRCFIYFKDDATVADELRETDPAQTAKLDALKRELCVNHTVGPVFVNPHDLAAKVTADLHRWLFDEYVTPMLQGALRGDLPRVEAQTLLDAVKDLSALSHDLVTQLKGKGFNVASGKRSVAYTGDAEQVHISTGDTMVYNVPIPVISALHQLPPPPRDFTGRKEELDELMSQIERGGVTISGLQGQGGIGKTALALKLAQQLSPRYPDAQFYLDLKGASNQQPVSVAEALSHVIRAYHPTAKLPEGVEELRAIYFSVLNGQRALVLMDNARDAAQVEPLVPPESCILLVTSRQQFTLPGLFAKRLDTLSPEESRELLLKIARRIGERADEIAKLCGYLPLALRLAASALAERDNLSPADYVRRLSDAQKRLELVEASLSLSYDLLSAEMQRLWRTLAVFPDTFDATAAAAVWETEADAAQDALGDLLKFSMLDWDAATARYRLHDLARLFADSRLSEAERSAGRMLHAAHYLSVLREVDKLYEQGGEAVKSGVTLFDTERRNIETGQEWVCQHAGGDEAAARLCNEYQDAGVYALALRQHPRENILWIEAALAAARQLKDHAAEGNHLGNLGNAYAALGETRRAIEFHEQALVIDREIGDRRGEGQDLGNLGNAYAALGETRRAVEFHEQALIVLREIGDRRGEGQDLGNLGNAYAALGETRRAVEFYEQYLVIAREIGDRRGEGNALGNLGVAYAALGETRRAVEFHEQYLVIAREIGDRRGEGNALGNLGNAYAALGETRRAIEFYEQALVIDREIGDRRGEGTDLGNLGNAYAALGETRRAIEFYEQHLTIAREIGDRRGEGNALGNLGNAYAALGETRRAIEFYEQALVIDREIGDRRGEGNALGNLGNAYADLGETRRAIEFYEQALVIDREIGDRRGEGNALYNTSLALDILGDRAKAIAHAEAALEIFEQIESPHAESARAILARWRGEA